MKAKRFMTPSPITASPKTNYSEAMHLMQDNHIHHLLIVDDRGNLIGVVSHSDMLSATPSPVTSLSVFEIYSLLDKVTMADIMSKPALAIEEDCSLAAAAQFMIDNGIGCLPVMREDKLVGIITDTDIFGVFVEAMGGDQAGSYVEVQMPDEKGHWHPHCRRWLPLAAISFRCHCSMTTPVMPLLPSRSAAGKKRSSGKN
jgi:acetoin utilization protein AcuB